MHCCGNPKQHSLKAVKRHSVEAALTSSMDKAQGDSFLLSGSSLDVIELESLEGGEQQDVSESQAGQSIQTVYTPLSGTAVTNDQGYRHIYVAVQTPSDLAALTQSLGGQQLSHSNFVTLTVPQGHFSPQQLAITDTGELLVQTQGATGSQVVTSVDETENPPENQLLLQQVVAPTDQTEEVHQTQILLQPVMTPTEQTEKPQEGQLLLQHLVTPTEPVEKSTQGQNLLHLVTPGEQIDKSRHGQILLQHLVTPTDQTERIQARQILLEDIVTQSGEREKPSENHILLQEVLDSDTAAGALSSLVKAESLHHQETSDENDVEGMSVLAESRQSSEDHPVSSPDESMALDPVEASQSESSWPIVEQLLSGTSLPPPRAAATNVDKSTPSSRLPPVTASKDSMDDRSWHNSPHLLCRCKAHGSMSDIDKPIFSWVQVGLSHTLTNAIPGCTNVFLHQFAQHHNLHIEDDQEKEEKKLTGALNKILCLHDNLSYLSGESQSPCKIVTESVGTQTKQVGEVSRKDKSVGCELLRPQFSRSGREIKPRLLDLPEDEVTVKVEPRTKPVPSGRGGRRQRGRPPKYVNTIPPLDEDVGRDEAEAPSSVPHGAGDGIPDSKPVLQSMDSEVVNPCSVIKTDETVTETAAVEQEQVVTDGDPESIPQQMDELETVAADTAIEAETTEDGNEVVGSDNQTQGITDGEAPSGPSNIVPRGIVLGRKRPKKDYESLAPFKFFCSMCSFKSKRESHFQKHLAVHKKSMALLRCNQCSFTTVRLSHLRRHELSHSSQVFTCRQCKYKTDKMKLLTRHYRVRHHHAAPSSHSSTVPLQIFSCESCDYKTLKPYQYSRHLRCHANLSGNPSADHIVSSYQCPLCPYKTMRKEHYSRHAMNVHSDRRPYLCDLCGKAFKRADALGQHKLVHQDKSCRSARFTCYTCSKAFRSQAHLLEHSTMHTNVRAYLCEHCGAAFKTRSVQRKHIQTIHCNPRSHSCSSCDKRFNTKYALQRHVRTHDTPGMRSNAAHDNTQQVTVVTPGAEVSDDVITDLQPQPEDEAPTMETETIAATATIEQTFEQTADGTIRQFPATYIQTNEATAALLYLTNFQTY